MESTNSSPDEINNNIIANPPKKNNWRFINTIDNIPSNIKVLFVPAIGLIFIAIMAVLINTYLNQPKKTKSIPSPLATTQPTPTPVSDATSNWETYSDPINKFSFKHPSEMNQNTYQEGPYKGISLVLMGPKQKASGRTQTDLSEGIMVKTLLITSKNALEYANEKRQAETNVPDGEQIPNVSSVLPIVIDGKTAYQYAIEGVAKVTIIPLETNILSILTFYAGFSSEDVEYYKNMSDMVISTFKFMPTNPTTTQPISDCVIGGCSSELCVDPKVDTTVSTCVFKKEFGCYHGATCARQKDGKCGWTMTDELRSCISRP